MEEVARFFQEAVIDLLAELGDFLDAVFRVAFWKLGAGLVLGTVCLLIVSALPEEYRSSVRAVILITFGLTALIADFGPIEWRSMLG